MILRGKIHRKYIAGTDNLNLAYTPTSLKGTTICSISNCVNVHFLSPLQSLKSYPIKASLRLDLKSVDSQHCQNNVYLKKVSSFNECVTFFFPQKIQAFFCKGLALDSWSKVASSFLLIKTHPTKSNNKMQKTHLPLLLLMGQQRWF